MKAFRFRLERVSKIRAIQAGSCRTRLAQAAARAAGERQSWEDLDALLKSCHERYLVEAEGLLDLDAVRQHRRRYSAAVADVHRQAESLAAAERWLDTSRAELVEAERRRKVLDRLGERRFEEHRRAGEHQDQKTLDEVGNVRHFREEPRERR